MCQPHCLLWRHLQELGNQSPTPPGTCQPAGITPVQSQRGDGLPDPQARDATSVPLYPKAWAVTPDHHGSGPAPTKAGGASQTQRLNDQKES